MLANICIRVDRVCIAVCFVFVALCVLTGLCFAQSPLTQETKTKRTSKMKEIQGEVTWIGKDRIAIVYASSGTSEDEILLPFGKNMVLQHLQSLSQIQPGDTVSIQYEEASEDTPDGTKITRVAKAIIFVRPSTRTPPTAQEQDSGESLKSGY
ncbi:MAG: hypothetical protein PHQ96_01130 [Candidatus Omnitrophica bacterium]|nr:hypothetical protein [Candidatus Omnitrophota bacterium]